MGNNNSYYLLIGHWVPGTGLSIPMHYLHRGCGLSSVFSFLVGTAQAALSLSNYFAFSLWIHVPSVGNVPGDSTTHPPNPPSLGGIPYTDQTLEQCHILSLLLLVLSHSNGLF